MILLSQGKRELIHICREMEPGLVFLDEIAETVVRKVSLSRLTEPPLCN
jgi:hypothetical protein